MNEKKDNSTFIIAEVSSNHGQNFERAVESIKVAKECGADAVKFQTYTPDSMTIDVDNEYFRINHKHWGGQTLYNLYKNAYTPWEWFKSLKKIADDIGIQMLSTSFDKKAVDLLEDLNVPRHKIASFELVDLSLIEYVAKTRKPLIMSTGMASVSEIEEAVDVAKKAGAEDITLLKCISSYPARPDDMNLKTIPHMKELFDCAVGLSDHTLGIGVSLASITLGATVIEKHFTLSRKINTPDSFFSIEPQELMDLVKNVKVIEKAIGKVQYGITNEEYSSKIFRRSLFIIKDMKKGDFINEDNVRSIRPSNGLLPKHFAKIIGRKAKQNITRGTPLNWELIE